jgi:autotransporter translocation and assembly factor TamB
LPTSKNNSRRRPGKPAFHMTLAMWIAAVLICIPFAFVLALHVPSVQKELIAWAARQIESSTNYKIELDSFKWFPFSRLHLSNVHVQADGRRILACEDVSVSYRISAGSPFVVLEDVYLNKPLIQLERSHDGKWLIPAIKSGGGQGGQGGQPVGGPSPEPFHLPAIHVDGGKIEASQDGRNVLSIKDITGTLHLKTVQGPNGPSIRLDLDNWRAEADIDSLGKWTVACSGSVLGNQLILDSASLSGPDNALFDLSGRWNTENFQNGKAALNLSRFAPGSIPALRERFSSPGTLSGSISVSCEDGKCSVEHNVQTGYGDFKGRLDAAKTGTGPYEFKMDSSFSDFRLPGLPGAPEMGLNGRVEASARMEDGRLVSGLFAATLDQSKIGGESLQKGDLTGSYQNGVLSIKSSGIKSSLADLKLSASADLDGLWDPKHAGEMKAEINLEKAHLDKLNSKIQQHLGGTVSFEAHYESGNFHNLALWHGKADANLNLPDFITLKAAGVYQGEQLKVDYDVDCRDIQKLAIFYPQWQGKGRVASRGTLNGKWPDLLWDGEITSPHFQHLTVQADQVAIKGKGKIANREDRHDLSLKAQNVLLDTKKIAALNIDIEQQKDSCTFQLKGDGIVNQVSARLSGRVEKIWDFPLVAVSSQGQLGFKDQSGSLECKFEMEKDGIRIQSAVVQQGKQKLAVSGGIISDSRTDLKLAVESINAGQIITSLGLKDAFSGIVSGQVQVSGSPEQPECTLNMQASNCLIQGKQRIDQMQFQGHYFKDALQLQGEMKAAAVQAPVAFSAKVPLKISFKPFQFDIKQSEEWNSDIRIGGLEAETILQYLPFLSKLGGQLQGEIHASGSLKQPVVTGSGIWKNGFFQEKRWPHPGENIQAEWYVDSRNIYVKKAEVSHLGGNVVVTGFIDYPRFETMAFQAEGTDVQIRDIYGIEGKVSGRAEVKETPQTADLTGTLRFSKAQMSLGKLETDLARNIEIIDGDAKGNLLEIKEVKDPGRFSTKLKMDVQLELPPSGTWVTGKGLKAEITGGLKLEKVPSGPIRLSGELQAIRGTFSFQGKELKITEGTLVFTGTPEPDPQLRILCRKDVKDVVLQALVSGPLSRPKLTLSSVPVMNQVDILSYFMFDHPAGDLSSNEKSQFQDRAAAWLGSQTSGIIKGMFGNSPLAPDAVGYRSTSGSRSTTGFTNNPTTATNTKDTGIVEVGKYITPDLFVKYGRSVTGEQGNEVQVEYRLNRHISVQTQVGGADQSGVDIFWRHDFGK